MRYFFLLLLVGMSLFACRSAKSIQHAISKKDSAEVIVPPPAEDRKHDSLMFMHDVYTGIDSRRISFNTFTAKVKVSFQGSDGKRNDFNAFIRLQRDSVFWVSINALLGIEAFRVIITPDSVKVLNKLDKVAQLRSVSYLKDIIKLPFTFGELQDLIIGNPIYFNNNIVSYKKEGDLVTVVSMGDVFKHLLTLNPANFEIEHSKLDDVNNTRARTADITYGDYLNLGLHPFSTFRKIAVSEKTKLDIEMKYKQFDFNVPLNFPFSVPKNYKLQ